MTVDAAAAARLTLSQTLVDFMKTAGPRITLGQLAERLSERSFASLGILFAAPNLVPLPPGASTVFGIPLIFIAVQMMIGMHRPWLPQVLANRSLDRETCSGMVQRLQPWLARAERWVRPRWLILPPSLTQRVVGFIVLVLAVTLTLPIPLGNWPPALAVTLVCLGLMERDGALMLIGTLVAIAAVAIAVAVVGVVIAGVLAFIHSVWPGAPI
jgi:hypothetical protein